MEIRLNEHIPSVYNEFIENFEAERYDNYSLYGGRGGVKSSIGALCVVMTVLTKGNVLCVRRYKTALKNSVYNAIKSSISRLGLEKHFEYKVSPLSIECKTSGYRVLFEGLDDEQKLKGMEEAVGLFRMILYEECQQIENKNKVEEVNATLARGQGGHCNILYIFNPPPIKKHWTNVEMRETKDNLYAKRVNYVDVPWKWLGEQFIREAMRIKRVDEELYKYRYLGDATGREGLIFNNIRDYTVNKSEFKTLSRGLDLGFRDPTSYVVVHFDRDKKDLYIVYEWYKRESDYPEIAENIKKEIPNNNFKIYADHADTGGIKQLHHEGLRGVKGCKKGNVENGIMWLKGLNNIYIDESATPETYREFTEYSYKLKRGEMVLDKDNNHSIDAVRYALSEVIEY